nr:immunoglobulin heavy chain junction region [Macaca mulatta]MOV49664.1 immunoglobulin heavy chain junction region [Macaca mulatta]
CARRKVVAIGYIRFDVW